MPLPTLTVFGNPPRRVVHVLSKRAIALAYKHYDDGRDYKHDFAAGVNVLLLEDGSVLLRREDDKPLFKDFR